MEARNPNQDLSRPFFLISGIYMIKRFNMGQVQWLTSVIPALWEAKVERSLELRSSRSA